MGRTTEMTQGMLRHWIAATLLLIAAAMFALGTQPAHAAPPAGTVIGNQATASYNDAGGAPRTATSNLVTTTVSQVKTFTLTAPGARTAAPGQTVYYPHTITNTGNGADTYTLNTPIASGSFAGAAAPHGATAYYIDADGNGVPDNAVAITTSGPVAMGGVFRFVVAGTVPAGAASGDTATLTASVSDTQVTTLTNVDTTTVANSVITVNKSLSVTSGPSPSTAAITVTLSYTNSGTAPANNVVITDILPGTMTYVAGTGRWSVSGGPFPLGTALTDATDGVEQAGTFAPGIDYRSSLGAGATIRAEIPTIPNGVSGNVTFQVNVNSNLAPQTINNIASYQTQTQASVNTNQASYVVLQTAGVVANGANNNATQGSGEPVLQPSAAPGSTFTFNNYIWNRGNGSDTFDMTITSNNFPAGTTVALLQQDGVTSLINSAGTAAPDTGPIPAPGAACVAPFVTDGTYCGYRVVVRVTLPAVVAVASYSVTKRATSVFDNSVFDEVIDTLTTITPNTVDVTNNLSIAGGANLANQSTTGFGITGTTVITTNPAVTPTAAPTVSRFRLHVNNTSAVSDSFNLSATFGATSAPGVTPPTLPVGWSVAFRADGGANDCSTVGASLTSTGAIAGNASRLVCAEVTVPTSTSGGAIAGNYDFDFVATSATNGAVSDTKRDRVVVNLVRSFTLTPNNTQQTFPGGSVTYSHTITNTGNGTDTATFEAACLSNSRPGWNATAYIDSNLNGILEVGTDTAINCATPGGTALALNVNESRTIFVRAFAPGSATAADPANLTTLTATFGGPTTTATDTTSVTDGLLLLKEQVAVGCAAAGPHAGYTIAAIPAGPATAPGQCIAYRITATNTTAGTITNVIVNDLVPANTRMHYACSGGTPAGAPRVTLGTIPGASAADVAPPPAQVIAQVGPLNSTQSAQLFFCVRIDP